MKSLKSEYLAPIPDRPYHYIVSYSGGIGSAVSCLLAKENNLDYTAVFADTLIEDEDLYRFNNDIEVALDRPIIRLCCDMNPWDVYIKNRYIGNSRTAHCSQQLKTDVIRDYMKTECSHEHLCLILGMSLEEYERINRAKVNWKPIEVDSLLVRYRYSSREMQEEKLKEYGIELPRLYSLGFPHNNCGGFCCRSGMTQFATLLKHFPKRYQWHVEQEERAYNAIGPTAVPFIRWTWKGKLYYLRMSEFRDMIHSGALTPPLYEYGGCGCFTDEEIKEST